MSVFVIKPFTSNRTSRHITLKQHVFMYAQMCFRITKYICTEFVQSRAHVRIPTYSKATIQLQNCIQLYLGPFRSGYGL